MGKGDIPLRKTFDGKRYNFYGSYGRRRGPADSTAKLFRAGGDLARVVKIGGEYCVYVNQTKAKISSRRRL